MTLVLHSLLLLGFYQPKKRWGHSAVFLNNDLYVWGGDQDGLPRVHSSDLKLKMTSVIEVFRGRIGRWVSECMLTIMLSCNMKNTVCGRLSWQLSLTTLAAFCNNNYHNRVNVIVCPQLQSDHIVNQTATFTFIWLDLEIVETLIIVEKGLRLQYVELNCTF